jgi:hypothetical protein
MQLSSPLAGQMKAERLHSAKCSGQTMDRYRLCMYSTWPARPANSPRSQEFVEPLLELYSIHLASQRKRSSKQSDSTISQEISRPLSNNIRSLGPRTYSLKFHGPFKKLASPWSLLGFYRYFIFALVSNIIKSLWFNVLTLLASGHEPSRNE